jgi:hypothetical protein
MVKSLSSNIPKTSPLTLIQSQSKTVEQVITDDNNNISINSDFQKETISTIKSSFNTTSKEILIDEHLKIEQSKSQLLEKVKLLEEDRDKWRNRFCLLWEKHRSIKEIYKFEVSIIKYFYLINWFFF